MLGRVNGDEHYGQQHSQDAHDDQELDDSETSLMLGLQEIGLLADLTVAQERTDAGALKYGGLGAGIGRERYHGLYLDAGLLHGAADDFVKILVGGVQHYEA